MSVPESLPSGLFGNELAAHLDATDPLRHMRSEFCIPSRTSIASKKLPSSPSGATSDEEEPCTYLVGNSLGLQPKRTAIRIQQYLDTWRAQGVLGHFRPLEDSPLPTWLHADARAAEMMAPIVGARAEEVAVMQTLTANLHLLMAAFYRPDMRGRHKIILEGKAFPSDHYVVESQIRHHGLEPKDSTVTLEAHEGEGSLTTETIKNTISRHASTTALLLLPGIQYYSGQLFDIPDITAFARSLGIFVIWDLAHAVGNVPLSLHDWDVDAAAWCTYKYLNSGPGSIGGLFVHERHSRVASDFAKSSPTTITEATAAAAAAAAPLPYTNRLAGWWGNDKSGRFAMEPGFRPVHGAAGFQLSNPSIYDITSLCASLETFEMAGGVVALRKKSIALTQYLVDELRRLPEGTRAHWRIITPEEKERRGAQISVLLGDGLLEPMMEELETRGVLVDDRKPNVIRVAPAPLYNTFRDCSDFVRAFQASLEATLASGADKMS